MTRRTFFAMLAPAASAAADEWAEMLGRYVNAEHLVDYAALKAHREPLDRWAARIAEPWPAGSTDARKAGLINAYNALTIRWILDNYPVESIWRTKKPFTVARHRVDGRLVSLDDIEGELRKMDPRIHGALVCAGRSCPPLRREPYRADAVSGQLDDNFRAWLAMPGRNSFDAARNVARVSKIFDWYKGDFDRLGGVRAVFARYSPQFRVGMKIEYQTYRWGLNDSSGLGAGYSEWNFLRDKVLN